MNPNRAKKAAAIRAARRRARSSFARTGMHAGNTRNAVRHSNEIARDAGSSAIGAYTNHPTASIPHVDLTKRIQDSHAKGMAKIGRQKSDLNGGNSVNRAPKNHTTRTSQAQRIASKIAARLAKRRYSDNTMGMSGSAAGSSVYRSVGGKTMAFALSSSAANKLHKEMQRPMRKHAGVSSADRAIMAREARSSRSKMAGTNPSHFSGGVLKGKSGDRMTLNFMGSGSKVIRAPIGMAGAKRPKGPASASSVSAARKKAWVTRRKKFGKSGGKKRR